MINAQPVSISRPVWRSMPPIPASDSAHVTTALCGRARVGKQTKTPVVYRLCSRPIAATMGIIERANYDSEKLRGGGGGEGWRGWRALETPLQLGYSRCGDTGERTSFAQLRCFSRRFGGRRAIEGLEIWIRRGECWGRRSSRKIVLDWE